MPDEPGRIDLTEFRDRKPPSVRKRKEPADPDVEFTIGDVRAAAAKVADDPGILANKSIEEISELAIRRMANIVLRGGDAFLPVSLKEASDNAKAWASIASMEAARKAGKNSGHNEEDPVVLAVRSDLEKFAREKRRPGS